MLYIAVNYNNSDITLNYIENINKIDKDSSIIIVDNASDNLDVQHLKEIELNYSNLVIIYNDKNVGYFKGLNCGINYVLNNKIPFKFIIVGNNDITFEEGFAEGLLKTDYSKNVLAIAPNVISNDNRYQNPHVIKRVSTVRKFVYGLYYTNYYLGKFMMKTNNLFRRYKKKQQLFYDKEMPIYMGIGAIYILTTSFFNYYSELDDSVFLWGEEALFANQISKVGGQLIYNPRLTVHHLESVSTSKIKTKDKYNQVKKSYKLYRKYL